MIRLSAASVLLFAFSVYGASAADIERKVAAKAVIASTVTVPGGTSLIFVSGTTASPIDPKDTTSPGAFGNTETQTMSALTKIKAQLAEMGLGMGSIVKLTVFMTGDPALGGRSDRDGMTASYKKFFGTPDQPNLPARTTVQVAALGHPATRVEIEAIAAKTP